MQVRFFAGTKADYLSLPSPRNPLGLYFCADTRELFWADRLISDGTRIVATEADLPKFDLAAEGITYFVEETRNGYVLSPDRSRWVKVIQAPDGGASTIKTISFAGIEMEEVEGVFTIDRRCARAALGFIVPEGMEDEELEIVTKDYVDSEIAKIPGADIDLSEYAKESDLEGYALKSEIPSIEGLATEQYVIDAIAAQVPVEDLAKKEDVDEVKTKLETEVLPTVQETILPTVQKVETEILPAIQELAEKAATQEWVREQGYLTEHQSLDGLATEEFVTQKIAEVNQNIENIESTYVTNETLEQSYITKEEIANTYITEEHVSNTYVTVQQAADYVTTEQVTEVVTNEVQTVVTEQIETKVTEVIEKKIEDGNLDIRADSISYDTW